MEVIEINDQIADVRKFYCRFYLFLRFISKRINFI